MQSAKGFGSPAGAKDETLSRSRRGTRASETKLFESRQGASRNVRESKAMGVAGAQKRIVEAVNGWEQVEVSPHRYGGLEFRLGRRELGHIHGDRLVDIPFP